MKLPTISVVVAAVCIGLSGLINGAVSEPLSDFLNSMSMKSFKIALQNEQGNFVFSPFAISHLFSIIAYGASGQTLSELEAYVPKKISGTRQQIWIYKLPRWNKYTLNIEHRIYINEKIEVREVYQDFISGLYNSKVERLNFDNIQNSTDTINNWIQNNNDFCLTERVKTDNVENITGLLLMSVIKFKAGWKNGFVNTETKSFEVNKNFSLDVPFLTGRKRLFMSKNTDLNATIVKLPYRMPHSQRPVSMFIIVPNEIDGLKHVEDNIDKINITTLQELNSQIVELSIPTFELETSLDLKEPFIKAGIKKAFTKDAEFIGINRTHPVYISKIIQKATISIDAEGTGATAASYDDLPESRWDQSEDINVVDVNRPFLVLITARNAILFTGRVKSPSW